MNKLSRLYTLAILAVAFTFSACDDDTDCCVPPPEESGFFIVNEGAFGQSNASLSYYNESVDVITNNIFADRNNRPLGDQCQSMTVDGGIGYVVVQNSGTVEIIDAGTFSSLNTVSDGIESPRYFLAVSDTKGYISDWGSDGLTGTVKILDLINFTITGSIPTGSGANRMLQAGPVVYVTNSGGFGTDNNVTVINTTTDEVVSQIEVGDNPNSLVLDASDNLWVLGGGSLAYNPDFSIDEDNSTLGTLTKIRADGSQEFSLSIPGYTYSTANNLVLDNDGVLYYTFNDKVWSMSVDDTELPSEPFMDKSLYGLSVHPVSGYLIGCEAVSFTSAGNLIFYERDGSENSTFAAGIAPNSVAFK